MQKINHIQENLLDDKLCEFLNTYKNSSIFIKIKKDIQKTRQKGKISSSFCFKTLFFTSFMLLCRGFYLQFFVVLGAFFLCEIMFFSTLFTAGYMVIDDDFITKRLFVSLAFFICFLIFKVVFAKLYNGFIIKRFFEFLNCERKLSKPHTVFIVIFSVFFAINSAFLLMFLLVMGTFAGG